MKVLIVEDNRNKADAILRYYRSEFYNDSIEVADSFITGLRMARDNEPDFVLLDMSLPNHSNIAQSAWATDMRPFAGKDFLRRIQRMPFDTRVLVISMFETFGVAPNLITLAGLDDEMKARYPDIYLGAVHYSSSDDAWQAHILAQRRNLG